MRLSFSLLLLASFCFGQGVQFAAPPRSSPPPSGENLPAQKIGANDLIAVSVYDSPEMTRTVRVGAEGSIRLPMVKKAIKAEGLMPTELEEAIVSELKAEQLILDPVVTVTMSEYHSHPISVVGAVRSPVNFQASTPVTLIDAITRAGGLDKTAGLEILVTRGKVTQRIPAKALIDASNPDLNILLIGGEEVRVPEIGKVFVVGMVKKPGVFPIQDDSETTVLQMLALAEGLQGIHSDQAYIYRREGNGSKNEVVVNLKDLIARKTPDVALQANDILYIPENRNRKIALAALEKILLFGSTAGATALAYGMIR